MPARIAIIEDNPANLELMRYLLSYYGHIVLAALDGQEGLALVRREQPDLVICDLQLPLVDGYEVARQMKADPALRDIPLVAVTAYSMPGDRDKGLIAGFLAYYAKPIEPTLFVDQIQAHLPATLRMSRKPLGQTSVNGGR
jgi:two-component system cell cycle response regulator